MSVILLTLKRKKREQEGEREIIAFLSIGKAKGNKKRLKERKRRGKMERIESKSIISIFTILYTRLILSANRSNDRERKRSKNVALNRRNRARERERDRETAAFSSFPLWMYAREKSEENHHL
jgi:hypothetical protein